MTKIATWSLIEESIRKGFVTMADTNSAMLGRGIRADAATLALLGISDVPDEDLNGLIEDEEFLSSLKVDDTPFFLSARKCYALVTEIGPIEKVDTDEELSEGPLTLSYYISCMPRETMEGWNACGNFYHPDSPLPVLKDAAKARLDLICFVQELILEGSKGCGFDPKTVSVLGDVGMRSVRNVFGPKGNKPILSYTDASKGARADLVWGNPLDCVEWLAGRRGFHQGRLTPEWVNEKIPEIPNLEAAAALPGIVAWLGQKTSEELAGELGWEFSQVRDWTRAINVPPEKAGAIAKAAGIDPVLYSELISKLTVP